MIKFLARIQFSIEMTMWLTVFVAQFGFFQLYESNYFSCRFEEFGAKLPALTLYVFDIFGWVRWWVVPIGFVILAAIEWKYSFSKWQVWSLRFSFFALILITKFAFALPLFSLCSQIK